MMSCGFIITFKKKQMNKKKLPAAAGNTTDETSGAESNIKAAGCGMLMLKRSAELMPTSVKILCGFFHDSRHLSYYTVNSSIINIKK